MYAVIGQRFSFFLASSEGKEVKFGTGPSEIWRYVFLWVFIDVSKHRSFYIFSQLLSDYLTPEDKDEDGNEDEGEDKDEDKNGNDDEDKGEDEDQNTNEYKNEDNDGEDKDGNEDKYIDENGNENKDEDEDGNGNENEDRNEDEEIKMKMKILPYL